MASDHTARVKVGIHILDERIHVTGVPFFANERIIFN
jgi:hypothetical protein